MTRVATTSRSTRARRASAADDYLELVRQFPLRPLRSDREYLQAARILDGLVLRDDLTRGESDYLDALTRFVEDYDDSKHPAEQFAATPREVLRHLMEQRSMNTSDLGRLIGSKGVASEILSGKRELSKSQIKRLSNHFGISPALLF
jgi:HTH-type transcriptional regulator/antitoxin HigA